MFLRYRMSFCLVIFKDCIDVYCSKEDSGMKKKNYIKYVVLIKFMIY